MGVGRKSLVKRGIFFITFSLALFYFANQDFFRFPVKAQEPLPLGIEKKDGVWHLWNELDDYYINETSGIQITADYLNFWTHNLVCARVFVDEWYEFCGDTLPWSWTASTDNENYVNLTGSFSFSTTPIRGKIYSGTVTLEYYLISYEPELKITVKYVNTGEALLDLELKIRTHDININSTLENDFIKLNTEEGEKIYDLSESLNVVYTQENLTERKVYLFDNTTKAWLEQGWNESFWLNDVKQSLNYTLWVHDVGEQNSIIDLIMKVSLSSEDTLTTSFWWADAPPQNFNSAKQIYDQKVNSILAETQEAYENGVEHHFHDWNLSIEMKPNGVVEVKYEITTFNENLTGIYAFHKTAHKFSCFKYPQTDSIDTMRCPENETNIHSFMSEFADNEVKNPEMSSSQARYTYSLPYLLVDSETGNLISHQFTVKPSEEECYKRGRLRLDSVFEVTKHDVDMEFQVDFGYTGTSHCIKFPIPRYSNVTLNVTMLSSITNFSLPQDFVLENYTENGDKTLVAKIRVYPCCGIKNVALQSAEVCSS
jgi:hypothetical protein